MRDIGGLAFGGCQGLTSVIIPAGVTNVQPYAFDSCGFLERVYFLGDRPTTIDTFNPATAWILNDAFGGIPRLTFFYMPGKAGWTIIPLTFNHFAQLPWNPKFGAYAFTNQTLQLTCTIPTNSIVVVENCTNLALNTWQPFATNVYVTDGPIIFTNIDDQITNKPVSLYRFRSP